MLPESVGSTQGVVVIGIFEAVPELRSPAGDPHKVSGSGFKAGAWSGVVSRTRFASSDAETLKAAEKDYYDEDVGKFVDALNKSIKGAWSDKVQEWEECAKNQTACPDMNPLKQSLAILDPTIAIPSQL
ncbi:Nuclease S1 [Hordeum vulgare]|nr:Nuclease S1 [Hordeum vulgare]